LEVEELVISWSEMYEFPLIVSHIVISKQRNLQLRKGLPMARRFFS